MSLTNIAQLPKRTPNNSYAPGERINSLKELTELEERREALEGSLSEVHCRIDALQRALFRSERRPLRARLKDSGRMGMLNPRRRMARGELRAEILMHLERAGSEGVKVHDLANELGMRTVNIHSWFHSAIKKFPEIQKTGPSQYQLTGPIQGLEALISAFQKGSGINSFHRFEPRKRGEVTQRILDALGEAGASGLTVSEIAERTASSYRRVHVWISSTGKRNGWVKRIARGTYGLAEARAEAAIPA